jgi:hypothetical protein
VVRWLEDKGIPPERIEARRAKYAVDSQTGAVLLTVRKKKT